ncbi:hypothetical protein EB75_10625 [Mycobacterium sp. ST-F2]|nr:hypothetical protein EB75_10625 [Mycobacterium sp. ST-F2]
MDRESAIELRWRDRLHSRTGSGRICGVDLALPSSVRLGLLGRITMYTSASRAAIPTRFDQLPHCRDRPLLKFN